MNDTLGQECVLLLLNNLLLTSLRCFHGFMTNQKSDSLLLNALQSQSPQAYYLVKYSFDSMGEFILTFITPESKCVPLWKSRKFYLFLLRINYVKVRNIGGQWQIGTSPKQYDSWGMIQQVCKQVIGIGSHISTKR